MNMFVELAWHFLVITLIPFPFILGAGLEILWEHRKARLAAGVEPGRPPSGRRRAPRLGGFRPAPQH